ncbi:hypothetical protein FV220_21820 [Methylobacterium sp. WL19]|nr:hypothetical protein FV220_21820 [Methylobacterium sp. WL19]
MAASNAARLADARKRIDTRSFSTTWSAAWAQAYPGVGCPEWTQKEAGILKKALKASWPKRHEGRVHEFLEWVVLSWDVIVGAKMGWMIKSPPPAVPQIGFVARMLRLFQDAWAEREELLWRGTQPGAKQEAIALAKREGIPLETAKARVIALEASARDRAAAARMVAEAKKERSLAAREASNRATRFTAANPHPRAHENVSQPINLVPGEPDWNVPAVFFDESKL